MKCLWMQKDIVNDGARYIRISFATKRDTKATYIQSRDSLLMSSAWIVSLLGRHNGRGSVSNHQPRDCLLNRLFRRRSKKTSKLRVTCLCVGNSPGTGEFPAQRASNAEIVSILWRHGLVPRRSLGTLMHICTTGLDISKTYVTW